MVELRDEPFRPTLVERPVSQNDFAKPIVNAIDSLASSNRRQILIELEASPLSYTELKEKTNLVKGTLNYHLKRLTAAGMVRNFLLNEEKTSYISYYEVSALGRRVIEGIFSAYKPPTPKKIRIYGSSSFGIEITDGVSSEEGEVTLDAASASQTEEVIPEWVKSYQR